MEKYQQLVLDFDTKTGSYVAIDSNQSRIVFKSSSPLEVFNWAKKRANILTLESAFKVPYVKRNNSISK